MNRAVGADDWGILGNKDKVSYGGELIRDMLRRMRNMSWLTAWIWLWEDPGHGLREGNQELGAAWIW